LPVFPRATNLPRFDMRGFFVSKDFEG